MPLNLKSACLSLRVYVEAQTDKVEAQQTNMSAAGQHEAQTGLHEAGQTGQIEEHDGPLLLELGGSCVSLRGS